MSAVLNALESPHEVAERPLDEEELLVTRAQAGNQAAFRQIFDLYSAPVHRYLRDLLSDADGAAEATQETFVRAHRGLPGLREPRRLKSWLFGIARRVFLEHLRRKNRRRPVHATQGDEPNEVPDPSPGPETRMLSQEARGVLQAALDCLPPDRRAAVLLRLDHDMPYEDIARHMGWSLSKVKNEIHRGRLTLRSHIANYMVNQ